MLIQVLWLVLAIVILYFGAELTLEASEKVGKFLGLSPLVIGLLLIGFGTSLPEFFVSQLASFRGEQGMALGNIVGSNIANLFLILGVSGLLTVLQFKSTEIKTQLIFHGVLTSLLVMILLVGELNWWNASMLGCFFGYYLYFTFGQMKNEDTDEVEDKESLSFLLLLKLIGGFVLLYAGGELLVSSGSKLAITIGISSYVISVIFIAFGTSLPELITAFLACRRKKDTDLIVGNVIGSNIFNVAFVLASLVGYQIKIKSDFKYEISVLIFAAIFLFLLSYLKKSFSKVLGVLFLAIYAGMISIWL